ncbi:MAG: DUF4349 domain-containing protein [Prolixibacteraceae bacterium]
MRKLSLLSTLILLLSTFACHNTSDRNGNETVAQFAETSGYQHSAKFTAPMMAKVGEDMNSTNSSSEQMQNSASADAKKIIKDGRISIKTNDIAAAKSSIDQLAKKFNAFFDNEELQNDDRSTSYDLKLRIPAENFENVLSAIENGGNEITGKSIHSRDVTSEYIDIETRINSKRDYLKRYKELLTKANTVKDILEIQESIRSLQEELESREKQLKYLSNQISFSTLDINIFKLKDYTYKPGQQDKFTERIKKSISNGWSNILSFVLWLIMLWPFILIIVLTWFFLKRIRKRRNADKK